VGVRMIKGDGTHARGTYGEEKDFSRYGCWVKITESDRPTNSTYKEQRWPKLEQ
jgi:hypothetical protein